MPRRHWILWLMLALLPLRSFAAGWLPVQEASRVAMQLGTASHPAPGCHEDGSGPSASCTLCDLCHGAAASLQHQALPALPLPRVAPQPAPARDTGRQGLDLLERPPRPAAA